MKLVSSTWRFKITTLLIATFLNLSVSRQVVAQEGLRDIVPHDEIVQILSAAYDEWLTNVAFKGTYEQARGRSRSMEEGLAGHCEWWSEGPDGDKVESRGLVVKKGTALRFAKVFPSNAVEVEKDGNSGKWKNIAFDEIVYGELQARHYSGFPGGGSNVVVEDRKGVGDASQVIKELQAGARTSAQIGPLSIAGGVAKSPLFLRLPPTAKAKDIAVTTREPGPNSTEVTLQYAAKDRKKTLAVTFLTSVSPPVVKEIHRVSTIKDYGNTEAAARASDFIECPGGQVARKVFYTVYSKSSAHPDLPWQTYVWTSKDLGEVAPSDADFTIPVTKQLRVVNVRPTALANAEIDLSKMGSKDLIVSPKTLAASGPKTSNSRRVWIALNLLVLLTLIVLLWLRTRRHAHLAN